MRRKVVTTMVIATIASSVTTAFMPYQPLTTHTAAVHNHQNTENNHHSSQLYMVLEKPRVKEIAKIEQLKVDSNYLIHPLQEVSLSCCVCMNTRYLCLLLAMK
jgi:cell division protein FtsL